MQLTQLSTKPGRQLPSVLCVLCPHRGPAATRRPGTLLERRPPLSHWDICVHRGRDHQPGHPVALGPVLSSPVKSGSSYLNPVYRIPSAVSRAMPTLAPPQHLRCPVPGPDSDPGKLPLSPKYDTLVSLPPRPAHSPKASHLEAGENSLPRTVSGPPSQVRTHVSPGTRAPPQHSLPSRSHGCAQETMPQATS